MFPCLSGKMRPTPKRVVKTLFIMSMMGFLIINLNLFLETKPYPSDVKDDPPDLINVGYNANSDNNPPKEKAINFGAVHQFMGNLTLQGKTDPKVGGTTRDIQRHLVTAAKVNASSFNISDSFRKTAGKLLPNRTLPTFPLDQYIPLGNDHEAIKEYIRQVNRGQKIRNLDKFDLPSSQNSIVIVMQVHDRTDYLKHVIAAYREAQFIEQSLLIFSHDYFSDAINKIIFEIDFCPVLQIFYPVPIQLYPTEFPGEDPEDCPRDSNREKAAKLRCNNADWPDKYGHYREARYTQTKHHWFWKVNHIFDHLEVTRHFNGPVLFTEDDHLVSADFIHTLMKMYRFRERSCKDCSILTLGTYLKTPVYGSYSKQGFWERIFGGNEKPEEPKRDGVEIMNWISSKHNMGMAYNREVWEKIRSCAETFCRFDDYNWDWSLQYVSSGCIQNKLRVMVMKSPRIFHIGECGMHKKGKTCDPAAHVKSIKTLLENNKQFLFPDSLEIHGYPRTPTKMPKPNGGWGDKRDHELCIQFVKNPDLHR